jgi:imidazolonepropionase-like amidohydrolase
MVVRFPQALVINLGEVPKQTYPDRRPGTRMGTAALIRGAFAAAANYQQKIRATKDPHEIETNLKHRTLLDAMDQRIATLIVAQRSDDLVTGIRLAQEYDLRAILGLAAEAYLISGRIKEAGYPLVLHPTMQRAGGSMETLNSYVGNAAVLDREGIPVAITSAFEGYVPKTRVVRREAALAMVYGMGFEKALASITINAARILQIDDRYGSLEPGKVADLVLYDGHPFETTSHVTHVIASGSLAFDRSKPGKAARWIGSGAEPGCCLSH